MLNFVYKRIVGHISFLVIVIGAMSFLGTNILMKEILSDCSYGYYSVFVTYLSLIYVFGIFGTEQVFLRFSKQISKGKIATQKVQFYYIISFVFFSAFLSSFIFKNFYDFSNIEFSLLFAISLCMISLLFFFNILRLNSDFVLGQIVTNNWKIVMLFVAVLFYKFNKNDFNLFIDIIGYNLIFVCLFCFFYIYFQIKFEFNNEISKKEFLVSSLHFFVSIFSFSVILFADRFLIESKFSIIEFGNYFYLTNFFLAPYSLFQNYIGFKQLIAFKAEFNLKQLNFYSKRVLLLGVLLAIFLLLLSNILIYFHIIKINFSENYFIVFLLLSIGITRLYSSNIVSAFEARTNIKSLQGVNIFNGFFSLICLILAFIFSTTIKGILIYMLFIWLIRSVIYRYYLINQTQAGG